ncbi:S9 family peptidase [Nonomuraea antri]|uniref:S9 family peptidase n=1 Tax=Nonomuraea antri TaxID=2730852 RepID=UPI001C2C9E99|nr:S9 family peptidase [Nonomuraea antri]
MTRPLTIDDLYRFAIPGDPDLSPGGERVVYTLTTQDAADDRPVTSLWEAGPSCPPRRLTLGPADAVPRWSPDGGTVAFLRQGRLHLLPAAGGEPYPVGGEAAGEPVWSPDGTRIAYAATDPAPGVGDAAPVVVDRLGFKADGAGLTGGTQLFVTDLATGHTTRLTSGDVHAGRPAWSPDGTRLAYTAATGADADVTGARAVHVVDATPGAAEPRRIGPGDGRADTVHWFPGGDALLVTGRADLRPGHATLLRQPLDGSPPVPLAPGFDRNVMTGGPGYPGAPPLFLDDDGRSILFCARDRGVTRLYRLDGDRVTELPLPAGTGVGGCSAALKTGTAALATADAATFAEIALFDLVTGTLEHLTRHTAAALPGVAFHPVTEREFTVSDGIRVHGFVTRDPQAPPGGPLLVDVHGGPHNAWSPHADPVHLYHQELATRGWTILTLNIRGSDGYGEDFYTAAVGGWGEADEKDVLEPVAELVAEGLADPRRIALTGYSYGGYLTCWLSARSDVFAAAVPGGVVTDLRSLAGTSDVGQSLADGEVGDDARREALSPLTHAAGVRAPTLILHGEADDRCPVGQAEQWFHALRARGVPVRLVRYPGASHLFVLTGRPSHRADYSRRLVDWVTGHTSLPETGAHHD